MLLDLFHIISAAREASKQSAPLLLVTPNQQVAQQVQEELPFLAPDMPVYLFPNWETLVYDHFSPHHDIISERLMMLYQLPDLKKGIVLIDITTLLQRLPPVAYVRGNSFIFQVGDTLDRESLRSRLESQGYNCVEQVMQHGEFAVRGSLFDVYPMGSLLPYRVDLMGDEIDSIRTFDPETQRTQDKISSVQLLPAHEFPLDEKGIAHFRQSWRNNFSGKPTDCPLYQNISQGLSAAGIESYLPLFFDEMAHFLAYLPQCSVLSLEGLPEAANQYLEEVHHRYEEYRYDKFRPLLPPEQLFLAWPELETRLAQHHTNTLAHEASSHSVFFGGSSKGDPLPQLLQWMAQSPDRVLVCASSLGRRELLLEKFAALNAHPCIYESFAAFQTDTQKWGIAVAPLNTSIRSHQDKITLIAEADLYGEHVLSKERRNKTTAIETGSLIANLSELAVGSAVVHIDHGIGLYQGLEIIQTADTVGEYLCLLYADNNKLYVPVANLHLVTRYGGLDPDKVTLSKLGSGSWEKDRQKAISRVYDVAADLLAIHAEREAKSGFAFATPDAAYAAFCDRFLFDETPDQQKAIVQVIADMTSPKPMDRLICGDVGFGKTEIAMRAAFLAVQSHRQVAILVPTTLLAHQHYETFQDRFAGTAITIDLLSRFTTAKEQKPLLEKIESGAIDIIIGTHKLLQPHIKFKNLGLIIIDEEHRFGVAQKEKLKSLRAEVDILTLTATPIPRTLNMALSDIRDLSIIATPPAKRLAIKTFVHEYSKPLIREALLREITRGGQVYFLHNNIDTIAQRTRELSELVPEAKVEFAHGQLRKQVLEKSMADFYHGRFNVLVCTTIIETGIDIPTANTIIMERADRFGLAQLHQLRGRVGRSHHQAYAYLLTPPKEALTADAQKRLDVISSIEDLGAGFVLASQDLEIRGAGEFLGDEQTGHIQNIGLTLYMEFLERAVESLKSGKALDLNHPLSHSTEVDLGLTALIPEDYVHDVHTRLVLYKRIAGAKDKKALWDLQVEMIDRFGLLPAALKTLFSANEIKLQASNLGIKKISVHGDCGKIEFEKEPRINFEALMKLIQLHPTHYKLDGADKLRFQLEEGASRAEVVASLLEKFSEGR